MGPDTTGELGSILGVWGHPDDEAWLTAGVMAKAVDDGQRVVCVTATKGERGFPDDDPRSPDERAAVREAEMAACLAELGVTEHLWLGLPDGGCADVPDEGPVGVLTDLIADMQPDTAITFGPDGATGHPDHIAASRWTTLAFERAAKPDARLLYATKTHSWIERMSEVVDMSQIMMVDDMKPESLAPEELDVLYMVEGDLLERKVRALMAQESQIAGLVAAYGLDLFRELNREEPFRAPRPSDWL